jgi:hypothetical protein
MKWFSLFTRKVGSLGVFVVLTAILCFFHSSVEAATINVDCGTGTLQSAIDNASSGDTLMVSGACNENIILKKNGLILDGGGTSTTPGAMITGNNTRSVVLVEAHDTIKGFYITGGLYGVSVVAGSFAAIVDNIIQNNTDTGIVVSDNSTAFIGILNLDDTTASPNNINLNGNGIKVLRSSSARIIGNMISSNLGDGILVNKVSHADISDNIIDGNTANGVEVSMNSGINLGDDKTTIFGLPNYTYTKNLGAGIACKVGGSVAGVQGSLNGVKSALSTDSTCVKSLQIADNEVMYVGNWKVTVVKTPPGGSVPDVITVNPDGTGTVYIVGGGSQPFTWTIKGKILVVTINNTQINTGTITWQGSNDFTYTFTSTDDPKRTTQIFKFHRIVAPPE